MIQVNNVPSPFGIFNATPQSGSTSNASSDSFENALTAAVNQTLQQYGVNPNSVNISIAPSTAEASSPSANAATNTSNTTPASSTNSSAAPVTSSPASIVSTPASVNSPAGTTAAPTTTTPSDTETTEDSTQAFDQAYWASQPAAVQALQNISDPDQRTEMATQLANEGYTIDVPIMVWGWDPAEVTSLRESYGYTWVPSALQNPVELAPGLSNPGMQAYDPNNPPSGSIAV